ncbi:hypothetical protein LTR08_000023 [Meristemomyces frigidus]|nr:hypothetical protein LTR08_000023 [Meristemomyces frigidus]
MPTATCLCGACHIKIDTIIATGIWHCTTCRKMTSAPYSINAISPTSAFHLVSGSPKSRKLTADTGVVSTLTFCGDCSSALWVEYSPMPEIRILKAGVLDGDDALELQALKPLVEQFTKRRAPWLCAVEGAQQFAGQQGATEATEMLAEIVVQKD